LGQDIFEFWSQIARGAHVHPADERVFARMRPAKHGFRLDCLPAAFGGRLRDAPIVLLYLSPGFGKQDVRDAKTDAGRDYYARRWKGYEPMRDLGSRKSSWMYSRTKAFGDFEAVKEKIALLNIGAYHSADVRSFASLLALPSSRVSLDWAQRVLFREAEASKRIVICMRSAAYWGLEQGRKYDGTLFAPMVNRIGYLIKDRANEQLIKRIRNRLANPGSPI
jgi:hypothetical protein